MELFNRFRDTVFLKKDSDLEKQLEELKTIRTQLENTDEIDKNIKFVECGIIGEKNIEFELKNANIGMYVLRDITLEYNNNKTQIDYMLFTRGGFYIIECKNLVGNINVDNNGQFHREYEYKGKKIQEAMYSPYTQAERHQDMIKKICSANQSKLDNLIFGEPNGKDFYRPVVVLANPNSILNTINAPENMKKDIIRADQLISYIKKDIDSKKSSELYREKKLKEKAEEWLARSVPNNTSMANKYLNMVNEKNKKTTLEKELKEFRKQKSTSMKVPAYYIFTDEEMQKIISLQPKSVEDLKIKEILSDIKIKYHGEEIIKIINKEEININQ